MRTAFNNSMVAHVWAQQSQREGHSNNMRFDGESIYSYGALIARFHAIDGNRCVLFNDRRYSNTTSAHQGEIRSAIPKDVPVFSVQGFSRYDVDHDQNLKNYLFRIDESLSKAARARVNKSYLLSSALEIADEADRYSEFFGLGWSISGRDLAEVRAQRDAIEAAERARLAAEHAELAAEIASEVEAWKRGEIDRTDRFNQLREIYLRVNGDDVETSHGATFPVRHARRAWFVIQSARKSGTPWHRNGQTVRMGHFQIDFIDPSGDVKAGCHAVSYGEICRLAGLLGLTEDSPIEEIAD